MVLRRILLFAAFVLCFGAPAYSLETFYSSNAMGTRIDLIGNGQIGEYEYVLAVQSDIDTQISRLLKNGTEKRRVVIEYSTSGSVETTTEGGLIVSVLRKADDLLVEEIFYKSGVMHERYAYSYVETDLVTTSVFDKADSLLRSINYERTLDGRLFRSTINFEDSERTSLYRFDESSLYESWLGDSQNETSQEYGSGILYRYASGNLFGLERWTGGGLTRTESIESTSFGSERVIEDMNSGERIVAKYTHDGKVIEESLYIGELRIERTRYKYLGDLLVESTQLAGDRNESRTFEYDETGTLSREVVSQDAVVKKIVNWVSDTEYYEDIFRDGKAALRVYFENDQKIREELLQ